MKGQSFYILPVNIQNISDLLMTIVVYYIEQTERRIQTDEY